LEKYTYCN